MEKQVIYKVAREFTPTPGVRSPKEGNFSGEEFLSKHLYPKMVQAIQEKFTLVIDLDGTAGYATSFLEAAFGGLIRGCEADGLKAIDLNVAKKHLKLISHDDPYLEEEIEEYMQEAAVPA